MLSDKQVAWLQYVSVALLMGWLVVKGVIPGWNTPHSDFGNYYVSARLVAERIPTDSLYNDAWFHQQMLARGVNTPGKFSPFPPATGWIMLPLSGIEPLAAQRVFMIINLLFVALCAYAFRLITEWRYLPSLLVVLAAGAGLVNNIAFGQLYLIMVTCLLIAIVWIEQGRPLAAGILLGLFAVIKYFPVVLIGGYFLLALITSHPHRKQYHLTVVYSLLTIAVLTVAQFVLFGSHVMSAYLFSAFIPHLSSDLSGQGMFSPLFQSWDSLARNLFVYDAHLNPQPFLNWPAGRTVVKMSAVIFTVIPAGLIMYSHSRSLPVRQLCVYLSLPAMGLLVVLPASATYHFILLLIPLALVIRDRGLTTIAWVNIALYCSIGFIQYELFFLLAQKAGIIFAYPRLWLMVLMFGLMVWSYTRESKRVVV